MICEELPVRYATMIDKALDTGKIVSSAGLTHKLDKEDRRSLWS
jgi:hypothetical protein